MAKQDTSTLPTLDDFTEVNDLAGSPGFSGKAATINVVDDDDDDEALKLKAEEAKVKLATEAAAKLAADTAAKKKADEAKLKGTAPATAVKLTEVETEALIKKAEEKPEELTEDERKYLIDNKLFEETGNFWEDVEKEHGIKVEVDFGDVDPESAKGAAMRDQALMSMAANKQLEFLQTTYPEAYQILEHVSNGGNIKDLINPEEPDFSKITLDKEDKEAQKDLLLNYYMNKGFDEKRANRMVEADEDSAEGLLVVAQEALKELGAAQTQRKNIAIENQKLQKAEVEKRNQVFKQTVKQVTDVGKLGDFTITNPKDKSDFYQFAVNNIYSDGKDGYQVVLPVNGDTMVPVLQQLFFGFKKGKLDDYVKREAQTQNVRKLQRRVSQSTVKSGGQESGNTNGGQKNLPTFDSFKSE
jgi:hypothetical protein